MNNNLRQTAKKCGASITAVVRWIKRGMLSARYEDRHWSIEDAAIEEFREKHLEPMPEDATLIMTEIARLTGFSVGTVHDWVRRDRTLKSYRRANRWYVRPADLKAFLEAHGVPVPRGL